MSLTVGRASLSVRLQTDTVDVPWPAAYQSFIGFFTVLNLDFVPVSAQLPGVWSCFSHSFPWLRPPPSLSPLFCERSSVASTCCRFCPCPAAAVRTSILLRPRWLVLTDATLCSAQWQSIGCVTTLTFYTKYLVVALTPILFAVIS